MFSVHLSEQMFKNSFTMFDISVTNSTYLNTPIFSKPWDIVFNHLDSNSWVLINPLH